MNITIRQLEVFCAIARRGHVGRAAEESGLSQSAASMALAELERQLGQPLFDRIGKRLALNGNGRHLFPKAVELLAHAEEIEGLFSRTGAQISGELRIGASSTIGNYLMPRLIGLFSQKHPDVRIALQVGNTDQIIHTLLDFDIDLGYIEGTCRNPNIDTEIWRTDELIIFSGQKNPLAKKPKTTRAELAASQWILREQGSGTREIFEQAVAAKLGRLDVHYELGHTEAVKQAVKNNLGISCLSRLTVAEELKAKTLTELHTPFPRLQRHFYRLQHTNKHPTRALDCFSDFIRQQIL
ncbi:MAG: LysR family transcriptional regulator [Kiritimatiellales bacterium]